MYIIDGFFSVLPFSLTFSIRGFFTSKNWLELEGMGRNVIYAQDEEYTTYKKNTSVNALTCGNLSRIPNWFCIGWNRTLPGLRRGWISLLWKTTLEFWNPTDKGQRD